MSVTRGEFMKQLGKSLPGMILGSGIAAAAHKVLGKVAAVTGEPETRTVPTMAARAAESVPVDFIKSGPIYGNRVALTFDDGPTPGVTDLILDELKRANAKATFFMIGKNVAAYPELARRVLAEGHEVGNHSYTHPHLNQIPDTQAEAEIQKTQDVIAEVLSCKPVWFRPPYGDLRQNQAHLLASRGLGIILWSVGTHDWAQPGVDKITGPILAETKPGSIIVCHDLFQQTVDSTKIFLEQLTARGLVFTTISELLR